MSQKETPKKYQVNRLRAFGHCRPNKHTEAVNYETPNGAKFSLAKDMMGTQFCAAGRLWPDGRSWPSMEAAVEYLKEHTLEAIGFFDSNNPGTKQFDVVDVCFAAAIAGQINQP